MTLAIPRPHRKVPKVTYMMLSEDIALLQTSSCSGVTVSTAVHMQVNEKKFSVQCRETLEAVNF